VIAKNVARRVGKGAERAVPTRSGHHSFIRVGTAEQRCAMRYLLGRLCPPYEAIGLNPWPAFP